MNEKMLLLDANPTFEVKADEAPKTDEVELFNADGDSRKVSDPSTIVSLEFNGWSRDKSVFAKKK